MSFDLKWDKIDESSANTAKNFLNLYFKNLQDKPDFLGKLEILELDFGTVPPSVELKGVVNPFEEFYDSLIRGLCNSAGSDAKENISFSRKEADTQLHVEFRYSGDFRMAIAAEICINYPTPKFMVLPFKLKVSSLTVTAEVVAAYLFGHMNICILDRTRKDVSEISRPFEIDFSIESEIGDVEKQGKKEVSMIVN